jgi:hypothetical protein
VIALEFDFSSILDFGGINTGDAEAAVRRASKGGMVSGPQLRGLVTLLNGGWRPGAGGLAVAALALAAWRWRPGAGGVAVARLPPSYFLFQGLEWGLHSCGASWQCSG